jgi:PII-like signaling protein
VTGFVDRDHQAEEAEEQEATGGGDGQTDHRAGGQGGPANIELERRAVAISPRNQDPGRLDWIPHRRTHEPPERNRVMTRYTEAALLRLFIGESDEYEGGPLHEAIVLKAREMGLAGATVLRGPMGFGRSSRLHTSKILRLSEDLPLIIEIVDTRDKVDGFIAAAETMLGSCLVTLEKVQVVRYGHNAELE